MPNRKQRRISQSDSKKQPHLSLNGIDCTIEDAFALALKKHNAGNTAEAIIIYRLILADSPNHIKSLNNLGHLYFLNDELDAAIKLFQSAIHHQPDYIYALYNLGEAYVVKGDIQKAEDAFLKILSFKPSHTKSLYHLAHIRKYQTAENHNVKYLVSLLNEPGITLEHKEYLYFALGKIFNECGLYDQAFSYYHQANQICADCTGYIPERAEEEYKVIADSFSKEFMAQTFPFSSDSQRPLFIIGMPRSGTTLLANMLSNHHAIGATGELQIIPESALTPIEVSGVTIPFPWSAHHLNADIAAGFIERYKNRLDRDAAAKKIYVIDKHPINFQYLGFIAMLFPKARVIHCVRNPLDTCLSNYFQYFDLSYAYSFDLTRVGHFYKEYAKLMAHWKQVLPMQIMDVHYEDTVLNMEETTKKILKFIDLDWDERCLSPHTNTRPVKTSSMWQVRQPVYNHSVERWRHYEKHLGPLKEALGDLS